MEKQVFSLKEAMDFYKSEGDYVQKHLGWFQLFFVTTLAVAWNLRKTQTESPSVSGIILVSGFLLIAIPNLIIMYREQKNVYKTAELIRKYLEQNENENVEPTFKEISKSFNPVPPWLILMMHIIFDIIVVSLVLYFMGWN